MKKKSLFDIAMEKKQNQTTENEHSDHDTSWWNPVKLMVLLGQVQALHRASEKDPKGMTLAEIPKKGEIEPVDAIFSR